MRGFDRCRLQYQQHQPVHRAGSWYYGHGNAYAGSVGRAERWRHAHGNPDRKALNIADSDADSRRYRDADQDSDGNSDTHDRTNADSHSDRRWNVMLSTIGCVWANLLRDLSIRNGSSRRRRVYQDAGALVQRSVRSRNTPADAGPDRNAHPGSHPDAAAHEAGLRVFGNVSDHVSVGTDDGLLHALRDR
jgi:hypothetical protein